MMIKRAILLASTALVMMRAFDGGKAGWKTDADGHLVLSNGNPVYVDSDGREVVTEHGTIARLNNEAKTHRERAEAAELKAKAFDGLDAAVARDAVDKLSKIDQKRLIDAGEVDKVKDEIGKSFQTQLDAANKTAADASARADGLTKQMAFATSKFIQDRVAVPSDMFTAQFGQNFKVEEGKLVPYDASGNKVYSIKRAGEFADVDEALEIIVNNYAYKDNILKAPSQGGSGNNGGGGARGGGRTVSRAEFEKMTPNDQAAIGAKQSAGEVTIVD